MAADQSAQNETGLSPQELLQSERLQFALAERAANFGYWRLWLADGRLTWSPGMYKILECDPSQRPDNNWLLSQIVDDDVAHLQECIANAIRTRSPFHYRTHARRPDAKAQIVDTHGEVDLGPDGRVISVIGVCHDVTSQVRTEAERERAERMYRLMTEEASDIIMMYKPDGLIGFVSTALARTLKREVSELEHGRFLDLVHPNDREEAHRIAALPEPGKSTTATYRMRHGDGHYIWIEATTRGVYNEHGEVQHVISVSRDVSERKGHELTMKTARERAESANRAKSTFLANMSHELRTPLNAIIGFADIMREQMLGPVDNPRYREYVGLIHQSGQLLLDLITDILDMAKIEAGKLDLHLEQVDAGATIAECTRLLAERAAAKGVELAAELPQAPLLLAADRRALLQIMLNLASNAVKFTPEGGSVILGAERTLGGLCISVRDTGIGIAPEDLPRLGRPFEQVSADPSLAKGGTGLGLALVSALVEKHGGTMKIDSELGIGTTVTVTLPVAHAVEAAA